MRRGAVLERLEQEAELLGRLLGADAEDVEHAVLDVVAVDTHRAAAHLLAVADDVVGVGHGVLRILVELVDPVLGRHRERVVHGGPLGVADRHVVVVRIVGRLEQREVDDPRERELLRVQQARAGGELDAHGAQQQLGGLAGAGGEEHGVARLGAHGLHQAVALRFGQVLGDGSLELAVLGEGHVGEALGTALLGPFLPCVELAARRGGAALEQDRAHVRGLEHAERRVLEVLGELDERVAEAQVRLVGAVLVHGFLPGDARQRQLHLVAGGLPDGGDDLLGHGHDVLLVDVRHLHVELGELGLAVGAEVLVAVAAGQLVVALDAGDHEQLLEQLRGLRQRVPGAGHEAGRHDEVAGALRGGLDERRGLDLGEVHVLQGVASGLGHVGAQLEVVLHGRATQVEVTVLETHVLAGQLVLGLVLERGGHLERQGVGLGEHLDGLGDDLDLAGGEMFVLVALRAQADLADDLDDEFAAQRAGHVLVVDDDLHEAGGVAQIDEGDAAVVAATVDPTGESDLLTDQGLGDLGRMMCSVSRLAHASSFSS
ncbi:aspartyl-tRNA synthase [Bifidobacterium stellenboschense]|uniref:Aspartyl-tRNA synthase n=1 Tax=Bifidobacterium stellenboschense TaxID=762211 RepID=A0A087DH98_9BIFI|nr:aspartyl-tRNA synthase [Bifidobacterium stellenboschense]